MIGQLARRPYTLITLALGLFVAGVSSYRGMPRESTPDVEVPLFIITTPLTGASPADVARLVTEPLEAELERLRGLEEIRSLSAEGLSIVRVELDADLDIDEARATVREHVDRARKELPEDVGDSDLREVRLGDLPMMRVALAGSVDEEALRRHAEALAEDFEALPGILSAEVVGGRERVAHVYVDPDRLALHGLSLRDVVDALRADGTSPPGGAVTSGGGRYLVRVTGAADATAERLGAVPILRLAADAPRAEARTLYVRDVARVEDGLAERESYARVDGAPAVTIAIKKRADGDVLASCAAVRARLEALAAELPEGAHTVILSDESEDVRDLVGDLENGLLTSLLLVVGVLPLLMGGRSALIVAAAIPLVMLSSLAIVAALGMTLNMIVLFSLVMAMGMLVDNAIVVVENAERHLAAGGDRAEAVIRATREVAAALVGSTATTVVAFVPLLFWRGLLGEFMVQLPQTVIIVLSVSAVVAIVFLPALLVAFCRPSAGRQEARALALTRLYRPVLEAALRHRVWALLGIGAVAGVVFLAYLRFGHGVALLPSTEPDRGTVTIQAPEGADLEVTDAIVRQVEAVVAAEPDVALYSAESGAAGASGPLTMPTGSRSLGRVVFALRPKASAAAPGETPRSEPAERTIERLRARLSGIVGAEIAVRPERLGPPVGAALEVRLRGDEGEALSAAADMVRRTVAQVPGVADVRDDDEDGRVELGVVVDRDAAARAGTSAAEVALHVRTALAGFEATRLRDGKDDRAVRVSLAPEHRGDLASVLRLRVPTHGRGAAPGGAIPLSGVASSALEGGRGGIRRVAGETVITVTGSVAEGASAAAVRAAAMEELAHLPLPATVTLELAGESSEAAETAAFLRVALAVSLGLVFFVLVVQFEGLIAPFVVLLTVALSLTGVALGLLIHQRPFGILMTGIGVIALAGIVVNNGIMLLDRVAQLRSRGAQLHAALVEASVSRLRPILLTLLTTVLGLVPMVLGVGLDFRALELVTGSTSARWWGALAIAIVYGLSIATVLTLIFVPVVYSFAMDVVALFSRGRAAVEAAPAPAEEISVELS